MEKNKDQKNHQIAGVLPDEIFPEKKTLEEAMKELDERHRALLAFEIAYFEKAGCAPTKEEIRAKFEKEYEDFTLEDAERLQQTSHIALKAAMTA